MKAFAILLALALASFVLAAVAPLPPANLHEFSVNVNPTNWLSATKVRFLPRLEINVTNGAPVVVALIEAWGDDVQDNGTTNTSVLQRRTFTLTPAQLTGWSSAPNGFAWLSNAILSKTKLTPRP